MLRSRKSVHVGEEPKNRPQKPPAAPQRARTKKPRKLHPRENVAADGQLKPLQRKSRNPDADGHGNNRRNGR